MGRKSEGWAKRSYLDAEIIAALSSVAQNGGNVNKSAREAGASEVTLRS